MLAHNIAEYSMFAKKIVLRLFLKITIALGKNN